MPCLQELLFMLLNKALDTPHLMRTKSPTGLKTYGIQPEFGNLVFSLYMYMRWL